MKYRIFNKETNKYEPTEGWQACIVTQHGEVAYCDEGGGWEVFPDQKNFIVILKRDPIQIESLETMNETNMPKV